MGLIGSKLALKAGETNGFDRIGPEVIQGIGERFAKRPERRSKKPRDRDSNAFEEESKGNGKRGPLREMISEAVFSQENPFLSMRPVDADGHIVYRHRRYYVNSELAGQHVTVSEMDGQLFVRSGDHLMLMSIVSEQPEAAAST